MPNPVAQRLYYARVCATDPTWNGEHLSPQRLGQGTQPGVGDASKRKPDAGGWQEGGTERPLSMWVRAQIQEMLRSPLNKALLDAYRRIDACFQFVRQDQDGVFRHLRWCFRTQKAHQRSYHHDPKAERAGPDVTRLVDALLLAMTLQADRHMDDWRTCERAPLDLVAGPEDIDSDMIGWFTLRMHASAIHKVSPSYFRKERIATVAFKRWVVGG